jgi:hypothetical protein
MSQFTNPKKLQFARGIKFANVPAGRADNVVVFGSQIFHVNGVMSPSSDPSDRSNNSGVVVFRGNDLRKIKVPTSLRHYDARSVDAYGNPVFSFTGGGPIPPVTSSVTSSAPPGSPFIWFDAQNIDGQNNLTLVDSGSITTWKNLGSLGTASNITQASGSKRPTFRLVVDSPQLNLKSGVRFDGVDDVLRSSAFPTGSTGSMPWTYGMLYKNNINTASFSTLFSSANSRFLIQTQSINLVGSTTLNTGQFTNTDAGQWEIVTGIFNGSGSLSKLFTGQVSGNVGSGSLDRISLGGHATLEQWFMSGSIVETLIYTGSAAPLPSQIESYFVNRYRMSTRVMYCGDDLTVGIGGSGSLYLSLGYRGQLWNAFRPWSLRPLGDMLSGNTPRPQFVGGQGLIISDVTSTVINNVNNLIPNICILFEGCNDAPFRDASLMISDISAQIDQCFAVNSVQLCLVASLPTRNDGNSTAQTATVNFASALPPLLSAKTMAGKPCIYIPVFENLNSSDVTSGSFTPNDQGYQKITNLISSSIAPFLPPSS